MTHLLRTTIGIRVLREDEIEHFGAQRAGREPFSFMPRG